MARVNDYQEYIKSGRWKCPDSPTGAHHSHEIKREGQYGYFLCKYCLNVKKLPVTLDAALKDSGKSLKDQSVTPGTDTTFTYKAKGGKHGK